MLSNEAFVRAERRRLGTAMLVLVIGPIMAMAGFHLAGSAGHAHIAIAAKPADTGAPTDSAAAGIVRQAPGSAGLGRSGFHRSRALRDAPRGSASSPSWGPGDLRVYFLRSTAAAHRGAWVGETSTPEFS